MFASSRIRFPVTSYKTSNKEVWREWRRKVSSVLFCATASTISSFYGHHYSSFRQTMLDTLVEKTPEPMAARAMKHGETEEISAKFAYEMINQDATVLESGEYTNVTGFVDSRQKHSNATFIMTTPDMVISRGGKKEIVEFKCPYFEIFMSKNRKNRTIQTIAEDFALKHEYGKEGSFLQGAIYALCDDISIVNIVYYFTDGTENKAMLIYTYDVDRIAALEDMVIDSAARIAHELQQEPGDIRYRTRPEDKRKLTRAMETAYLEKKIYFYDDHSGTWGSETLDEQTSNDSEEDGPEEPREISGSSSL